ncbi:GSCFA domain-containing protein [Chenggangzhangella methanolivorans]|uniref:GSCFA domain-containing protein n=1 Tax=Chenggangzhangella methanolivorans TaxID=1437009 RepID=A0A9E6RD15_9HYPH|nr:GSCFA domain-containing protein [Chenggangzhangella methanolivorans]QZN98506.1 GSCFA domain-containing protein [Chenggangzhangella methanolivorans]
MGEHPYRGLPAKSFWNATVRDAPSGDIDPVGRFELELSPETRVATSGSCFAQHIARHLSASGLNYFIAEDAHPLTPRPVAAAHQYGVYSARFGNVYTARQLLQLFRRAHGSFEPQEDVWIESDGSALDPFRPTVQPGGFANEAEMRADRAYHLSAVRRMFSELDVLIFTLGLTECWRSRADGAVFPICPGVSGGVFDPALHEFYNQTLADVHADMSQFLEGLRSVNPRARVMLTVSPVPLAATAAAGGNVVSATVYSKSVLRVAAEMLAQENEHVQYFPSYEIITGPGARGAYYAEDLRNVTEAGVAHVMKVFMAHATLKSEASRVEAIPSERPAPQLAPAAGAAAAYASASQWVEALCDEQLLDQT